MINFLLAREFSTTSLAINKLFVALLPLAGLVIKVAALWWVASAYLDDYLLLVNITTLTAVAGSLRGKVYAASNELSEADGISLQWVSLIGTILLSLYLLLIESSLLSPYLVALFIAYRAVDNVIEIRTGINYRLQLQDYTNKILAAKSLVPAVFLVAMGLSLETFLILEVAVSIISYFFLMRYAMGSKQCRSSQSKLNYNRLLKINLTASLNAGLITLSMLWMVHLADMGALQSSDVYLFSKVLFIAGVITRILLQINLSFMHERYPFSLLLKRKYVLVLFVLSLLILFMTLTLDGPKNISILFLMMVVVFVLINSLSMLEKQEFVLKHGYSEPIYYYIYEYAGFLFVLIVGYFVANTATVFLFSLIMARFLSLVQRVS